MSNPHMTRPPMSAPGGLSSINNSLLTIRNICEAVETFLLHLQCGPLLMLHRLKAKTNSTFEIHFSGGGGGGSIVSRKVLIKNGFWLFFCSRKKDVNIKM